MGLAKTKYVWVNGRLVGWDEAKVHVLTHALHYGSSVFEGIRCYETSRGPAIFRLKEHMERLEKSAKIYMMKLPYTVEELCMAAVEVVKANGLKECYIRPIAFRGTGEMGLQAQNPVEMAMAAWPWGPYLGEEGQKKGIRVKVSSYIRPPPHSLPMNAKAGGHYLSSILAKMEAVKAGYDEAIMLDHRGFVSEGSGENIFIVKDGVLYTPPLYASILLGITRDTVMVLANDMGYKVAEEDLTRSMLYTADEAFFTGTAAEVTPIREIDDRPVGGGQPGPITMKLLKEYKEVVHGRKPKYDKWLTYVK
ncbi:MAG: branched-chain amino acid transaminase [Candidatus Hecatellaceae archaeon]|nr:MAG: branched chain amino acid aminotransferase [Candidatus Hecatellales archaeon]